MADEDTRTEILIKLNFSSENTINNYPKNPFGFSSLLNLNKNALNRE